MIYRSNLIGPSYVPTQFKHTRSAPEAGSFGHDVLHDWGDGGYPLAGTPSGFLTHDEAAILYSVVGAAPFYSWLDIGANTGWTMAHIASASRRVVGIDPLLKLQVWQDRIEENLRFCWSYIDRFSFETADVFFEESDDLWHACCIDGDHAPGAPLRDAMNAVKHGAALLVFHDFIGGPVQEAVQWLMSQGFKARVYMTPYMLTVCWRGDFVPPYHVPDSNLPDLKARCPNFDFNRCS